MKIALKQAELANNKGEVPVGAVIVRGEEIIAQSHNKMRQLNDSLAHAELLVIREAQKKLKLARLSECDIYVTLEPCTMCAGAIAHAKLRRLYYGAEDIKGGAVDNGVRFFYSSICHHKPEIISGLDEKRAEKLLKQFFALRR